MKTLIAALFFAVITFSPAMCQVGPDKTAIITYKNNVCSVGYELDGSDRVETPCETFSGHSRAAIFWAKSNKIYVNYRGGWGPIGELNKKDVSYSYEVPMPTPGMRSRENGTISVRSSSPTQLEITINANGETTEDNPSYFRVGSNAVTRDTTKTKIYLSSSDGMHCQFSMNAETVSRSKRTANSNYRIIEGRTNSVEPTCIIVNGGHVDRNLD
jgi:hypothetical protein